MVELDVGEGLGEVGVERGVVGEQLGPIFLGGGVEHRLGPNSAPPCTCSVVQCIAMQCRVVQRGALEASPSIILLDCTSGRMEPLQSSRDSPGARTTCSRSGIFRRFWGISVTTVLLNL